MRSFTQTSQSRSVRLHSTGLHKRRPSLTLDVQHPKSNAATKVFIDLMLAERIRYELKSVVLKAHVQAGRQLFLLRRTNKEFFKVIDSSTRLQHFMFLPAQSTSTTIPNKFARLPNPIAFGAKLQSGGRHISLGLKSDSHIPSNQEPVLHLYRYMFMSNLPPSIKPRSDESASWRKMLLFSGPCIIHTESVDFAAPGKETKNGEDRFRSDGTATVEDLVDAAVGDYKWEF